MGSHLCQAASHAHSPHTSLHNQQGAARPGLEKGSQLAPSCWQTGKDTGFKSRTSDVTGQAPSPPGASGQLLHRGRAGVKGLQGPEQLQRYGIWTMESAASVSRLPQSRKVLCHLQQDSVSGQDSFTPLCHQGPPSHLLFFRTMTPSPRPGVTQGSGIRGSGPTPAALLRCVGQHGSQMPPLLEFQCKGEGLYNKVSSKTQRK
ncbi:hypothetical protein HJG60_012012 [Phyllostomus discolor]|uniref:Uncharacterized protein n=1 Tax=Phyllostomus discolor TaxID=89673 RepID=A0A834DYK5_9CHIR|nr:hypothetical protein HJG60_012012 [Phyllostomus discolor]